MGGGGLASLLSIVGFAQPHDHAFAVQEFMLSRDAVERLQASPGLRAIYERAGRWDVWFGFPNGLRGSSDEHLWRHWKRMAEVIFNANSGIAIIRVRAFRAEDAEALALGLLTLAEDRVNAINARVFADALRLAESEVARAEQRATEAQAALSGFRARELTLDPVRSSVLLIELLGRLNAEVATLEAQAAEMERSAPGNPALPSVRGRAEALRRQIAEERRRAAAQDASGLGEASVVRQLAEYDRLNLERDFANRLLTGALQGMQAARVEARRQQLFLERVVEPRAADWPAHPQVLRWSLTIAALNAIGLMIAWLLVVGVREHRRGLELRATEGSRATPQAGMRRSGHP